MAFYRVQLSTNQLFALLDIVNHFGGEETNRFDRRTFNALKRKGLVWGSIHSPSFQKETKRFAYDALEIFLTEKEKQAFGRQTKFIKAA